ncbi:MAG TPA: hypothetical protein VK166_07530 [Chitinophagaceae bacterium]|nr:hypothetical protein [Chitinophagaceae bacterium]
MKRIYLIMLLFCCSSFSPLGEDDIKHELEKEYREADAWLKQHQQLIVSKASMHGTPPRMLMAIVFPELVRYNVVYDFMETTALSILYVQSGARYADFSIGHFQMKPSFAEMVEQDALTLLDPATVKMLNLPQGVMVDDEVQRRARISRLESIEGQMDYLLAFYRIMEHRTRSMKFNSDEAKLRYYATCYNSGYRKPAEDIDLAMKQKSFYTGKVVTSAKYNYAELSLAWYGK